MIVFIAMRTFSWRNVALPAAFAPMPPTCAAAMSATSGFSRS